MWIVAFLLVGVSIFQQFKINFDNKTAAHVTQVGRDIENYARSNHRLPESLSEVKSNDAEGLTYRKIDEQHYELCATFKRVKPGYKSDNEQPAPYVHTHGSGYQCFKVKPYIPQAITSLNNSNFTDIQKRARDNERQTDIKVLHGQIEAYFAQNGRYPTLADMNSASFRSTNLKGLDSEALKDPVGQSANLVAKPIRNTYSYDVTSANGSTCNNTSADCTTYTLTAILEVSGTYTKSNLN